MNLIKFLNFRILLVGAFLLLWSCEANEELETKIDTLLLR